MEARRKAKIRCRTIIPNIQSPRSQMLHHYGYTHKAVCQKPVPIHITHLVERECSRLKKRANFLLYFSITSNLRLYVNNMGFKYLTVILNNKVKEYKLWFIRTILNLNSLTTHAGFLLCFVHVPFVLCASGKMYYTLLNI